MTEAFAVVWQQAAAELAADAETKLIAQAHASAPLRRALARIAGRVVASRGWERLGFARLEDYAAECAGVSARELRDLARVDRALAALPALAAAFLSGEISWTKLRLLCRLAQPADEQEWLVRASVMTARALTCEVRAVDRAMATEAGGDESARVGVAVRCTPAVRARWWRARQLANRVAGHALSTEGFVDALTGEVLSAVSLPDESGRAEEVDGESRRPDPPLLARSTVSIPRPPFLDALERDLDTADAFELDARLRRALRLEAGQLARVAGRLDFVIAHGLHRDLGYRGVDDYAEERLGMAPSRARALLSIERAGLRCPLLREAFASGRLSWVQTQALIPLLFEPGAARHRPEWLAHAERVSVRRLRDDVERALAIGGFAPPPLDPAGLSTGATPRSHAETARIFFTAGKDLAHLFRRMLANVQRRIERIRGRPSTASAALDAMLEHVIAAWQPEKRPPREHAVFERDGWRCTVPGCSSYRNLHAHHVVFRSQSGPDDASNLTTLCAWHHLRGVHASVVRCTGTAPHALRFELGRTVYGPGEVRMS